MVVFLHFWFNFFFKSSKKIVLATVHTKRVFAVKNTRRRLVERKKKRKQTQGLETLSLKTDQLLFWTCF